MPTTIETTARRRATMPAQKVFTKKLWRDNWTERVGLWCKSLEFTCAPSIGEAVLEWRYGHGCPPGDEFGGIRAEIDRLEIRGHYVKIIIDPDPDDAGQPDADGESNAIPVWAGRIVEVVDSRYGVVPAAAEGETVETGVQTFVCWDLAAELDRNPLKQSQVAGCVGRDYELTIDRVLGFNCQSGGRGLGDALVANRSAEPGEMGVYVFAKTVPLLDDATEYLDADQPFWTLDQIVQYLITCFGPGAEAESYDPSYWRVDGAQPTPDIEPKLACEGMTVKQCLDKLFDRRRALGWYVSILRSATGDEQPWIVPYTHCDEDIRLETGETIPANPNTVTLDFDRSLDIQQAVVRDSEVTRYDQVRVRGGRMGVVLTLKADDQIVAAWTAADETAYETAASGEADYPADVSERGARNAAFRMGQGAAADGRVQHVYSRFALADDWDGKDFNGATAIHWPRSSPTANRQEDVAIAVDPAFTWRPGLRFEHHLPLHAGVDYSSAGSYPYMVGEGAGSDSDFLPPLVIAELPAGYQDGATTRYIRLDGISALAQSENGDSYGLPFSCRVAMRDDDAGLTVRVSGGYNGRGFQQQLAAADFTGLGQEHDDEFFADQAVDWKTMHATVYMLLDQYAEIYSDLPPEALDGRDLRVLTVDVPDAHLDYIQAGTIIGLKDGEIQTSTGGVIRSDLPRLKAIAEQAAAWYCRERKLFTLQYRQVRRTVDLGQLVTQIGSEGHTEDISTVVTRIRYDLEEGVTTIQTGNAELDCKQM